MFTAEAIWGLDIGDSSLKAVKLSSSKGDVLVEDFGKVELDENVKKGDGYFAAVAKALEKLVSKKDFSKSQVCISISSKNANSQFITLEAGLSNKAFNAEVLEEAERQIPFPLDEVEWGYHKMEEGEDAVQVALFAARTEHVNSLLKLTEAAGLDVRGIQVPGVALYNFMSELMDVDEHLVLLDFGEKSTGLLVVYDQQFWLRSLPLSGAHITNLLEKKFRITTAEANTLKHEMEKSPQRDKLFRVIEPKLKELVIEIKRSINFRRTQTKSLDPKQFLAWGGSSQLPGVADFFTENLGLKSCALNLDAFDFDPCDGAKALKENIASYGVAFGLALQGLGRGESSLNLAPQAYVRQSILKTKRWPLLVGNVALLAGSLVAMVSHGQVNQTLDTLDSSLSKERSALQREIQKFNSVAAELAPITQELSEIESYLKGDLVTAKVYHAVVDVISKVDHVYLTSFSMTPLTVDHFMGAVAREELEPIQLRLTYVGQSAKDNRMFSLELLKHELFLRSEGDPQPLITASQKDFNWSYTPKVELPEEDVFAHSPEVQELREKSGWIFEQEGKTIETPMKMNVQSMTLTLNLETLLQANSQSEEK